MSIDTRNKRASILGLNKAFAFIGPKPDSSLNNELDKQQIAFSYAGIYAIGGIHLPEIILSIKQRTYIIDTKERKFLVGTKPRSFIIDEKQS